MYVMLSSLGCDKNLVESEMMLGLMADAGYQLTDDEMQAEIIIVNTCSFIADAKQESIDTLIEYGELKKTGNLKVLVCAGCLGQRYTEDVKNELPEVDIIIGTTAFDKIDQAIKGHTLEKNPVLAPKFTRVPLKRPVNECTYQYFLRNMKLRTRQ